jgi:pSer/pThr/pTyr-binding forkhead associated (FHA) protein
VDPDQFKILSPSMPQKPPMSPETEVIPEDLTAESTAVSVEGAGKYVLKAVQNADFTEYRIDKSSIIIGKGNTVDIKVKGMLVAPVQARISKDKENYVLANIGKRKLTTVNGQEIYKTFLKEEDTIQIGRTIFVFTKEYPK